MNQKLNDIAEEMTVFLEQHEAGEPLQPIVLSWLQRAYDLAQEETPQPVEAPPLPRRLSDYSEGDFVSVLRAGMWVDGKIESIEHVSGHLHVGTEFGPVTVGNDTRVKPTDGN